MSGSTGAGNEVIMLLMGRDKQADQCVSTIAEQKGLERGAGLAMPEKWQRAGGLRAGGLCPGASRVSWGLLSLGAHGSTPPRPGPLVPLKIGRAHV